MYNKLKRKLKAYLDSIKPSVPNPKKTDIYLVSYPKSGNTWMRYLLAYAIWPEKNNPDLLQMAGLIPSFGLKHDAKVMMEPNAECNKLKHRIIKEHFTYNRAAKKYAKKAIYICRDGRDAIVSYWHFCNQRDNTHITLSDFIELSSQKKHLYGSWKEHVNGWFYAKSDVLIIRYEDMLDDTFSCLKKALEFSEIDREDKVIAEAVERASFSKMKQLEQSKGFNLEQLKNVEFVRRGKTGSWKDIFEEGDLERFKKYHGDGFLELGYKW